jgi:hypothetical protein
VTDRIRRTLGVTVAPCDICGAPDLAIVESRSRRSGLALVNPAWRPHVRQYELCRSCGVKYLLRDGQRV